MKCSMSLTDEIITNVKKKKKKKKTRFIQKIQCPLYVVLNVAYDSDYHNSSLIGLVLIVVFGVMDVRLREVVEKRMDGS